MPRHSSPLTAKLPGLNFSLVVLLLIVLWFAGGASRADVLGQTVVRAAAWLVTIAAILFARPADLRSVTPVTLLLLASGMLVLFQLVPLPPSMWTNFPGRELLSQSAIVSGQSQPWRPISISPDATANALSSLIVPAVVLLLMAGLVHDEKRRLLPLLLGFMIASSLVGLLQFSGSRFDNPFINDASGAVSGIFANRNHFALLLACGCVLAPAWAFQSSRTPQWRAIAAAGFVVVFLLMILATGSRMGILLGVVGIVLGLASVGTRIRNRVAKLPRRVAVPLVASAAGFLVLAVFLSIVMDRAISVERAVELSAGDDLRTAALPTIWQMVQVYWPVGSGFGAFDPAFRIHEPDELLSIVYLNRAHNDWLEVVLDGGLFALVILVAALGWWVRASLAVWRAPLESKYVLPRAGSVVLLLIALASLVDYPARTPTIMALAIIAAVWLNTVEKSPSSVTGRRQR